MEQLKQSDKPPKTKRKFCPKTVNREPKYGGGVHPQYGSCRGFVSLIPRVCIGVPTKYQLYGEDVPTKWLFPSHGLFDLLRGTFG